MATRSLFAAVAAVAAVAHPVADGAQCYLQFRALPLTIAGNGSAHVPDRWPIMKVAPIGVTEGTMAPKTRAKASTKPSDTTAKASRKTGGPGGNGTAPDAVPTDPLTVGALSPAQPAGGSRKASVATSKGRGGDRRGAAARAAEAAAPSAVSKGQDGKRSLAAPKKQSGDQAAELRKKVTSKAYDKELAKLYVELVKLQEWIRATGRKVVVLFEGRDAAGKGGVIKRITEPLNPRYCRVVALPAPTDREKSQWYFQRYVAHLPSAGEIVLFDRSWYNRAGVDRVMGFCTEDEYREFLRSVPEFERMLQRSGVDLVKYWFSVSDAEQERRFQARIADPTKRWKLSPMDLESRARWVEYSKAKDEMFAHTDTKQSPWWVVPSDDKKRARLNTIVHLLSLFPYVDLTPEPVTLPPRRDESAYVRPPMSDQTFVPQVY